MFSTAHDDRFSTRVRLVIGLRQRDTLPRVATDLIEIDPHRPSAEALDRAAAAIRSGRVVAVPTDALYTLIADPFSLPAVRKIYQAKGRENHRALPAVLPWPW